MVRDIKYIIKRIIIGVGIALALMFLKGTFLISAHAQELSSTNVGAQNVTVNAGTAFADFTIQGNPWANWRLGHLYFDFGITKTAGSSTDPLLVPRFVQAISDTGVYICNFGSVSYSNSTYTGASYSVDCPMDLGWPGLTGITIGFMPFQASSGTTYNVQIGGWMTFEQNANTQVNVDTSGTTTAINNQITNDNTNTQSIINNQNSNTEQQIESQKVCTMIDKANVVLEGYYLYNNGLTAESNNYGITDYIPVVGGDLYVYSASNRSGSLVFYNTNKQVISGILNSSMTDNQQITIPEGTSYIRATIRLSDNLPTFKLCRNGNQAIADGQQQINDSITSTDGVSDNDINSLFQELDVSSDTPISDLLTMPITLVQAYINGVGGTCSAVNLGSLYGTNLILPCIDLEARLGSGLWNLIDVLFSLFMIYNIAMLIINIFDKVTSLDDTFSFFTKGGDM